jgi:hypothetical protein
MRLEARDLSIGYRGHLVGSGISLALDPGEVLLARDERVVEVFVVAERCRVLRINHQVLIVECAWNEIGTGIPDDGFAAAERGQPNFSHSNRLGLIGICLV